MNKLDNYWPSLSLLKSVHIEKCIPSETLISTHSYFSKFANYKHFRGTIHLDTCCSCSVLNLFQTCKSFLFIAIQQQKSRQMQYSAQSSTCSGWVLSRFPGMNSTQSLPVQHRLWPNLSRAKDRHHQRDGRRSGSHHFQQSHSKQRQNNGN